MAVRSASKKRRESALFRLAAQFPSILPEEEALFEECLEEVIVALSPADSVEDAFVQDIAHYTVEMRRLERELARLVTIEPAPADVPLIPKMPAEHRAVMEAGTWQAFQALSKEDKRELISLVEQLEALQHDFGQRSPLRSQPKRASAQAHAKAPARNGALIDQITREIDLCSRRRRASTSELERYRQAKEP